MVLVTRVTKMLGIRHPIVQGGMHYVGYAPMAAAVSNAGGLGIITALTQTSAENLRLEIRKCKKLTNKPFGVNLTLLPMLQPPDYPSYVNVIIEEGVKIVETAGRNPAKIIKVLKKHNIIIIHKCVAIRHALTAQRLGVDIVSMDGFECAGHPGEEDIGNLVLLPIAARKLRIPFLASGGIGDGKQLAAALALGADGVNMGTRFMATKECPIHENIKQTLLKNDERATTHIFRSLKNTERVYKNKTAIEVRRIEKEKPGDFMAIRHLVKGALYGDAFLKTGDAENSVWSCGIVMGLIDDIPSCSVLIDGMMAEAESIILKRLPSMISKL